MLWSRQSGDKEALKAANKALQKNQSPKNGLPLPTIFSVLGAVVAVLTVITLI